MIIENILSAEYVQGRAKEKIDFSVDKSKINLVTACRISNKSKAIDRAVRAFALLKQDHMIDNLVWYIIGDGSDLELIRTMIHDNQLESNIKLLGMHLNPYPYFKDMSMFFLPSLWEGKPMVVTEAGITTDSISVFVANVPILIVVRPEGNWYSVSKLPL